MYKKILSFIPPRFRYRLSNVKNNLWGGYKRVYYSQFGEDIVLGRIFKNKKEGFFVDVGAHHPKRYSNTYLLYKRGWRGINIDPNPESIKLFTSVRSEDINVLAGVALKKGELTYYQFSDSAVNTFDENEAKRWMGKKWLTYLGTKKVQVYTLSELISKNILSGKTIDLLLVDVEGKDLEVLQSNDWNKYKPKIVVVEGHSFNPEDPTADTTVRFLKEKGYSLVAHMRPSLIFIQNQLSTEFLSRA